MQQNPLDWLVIHVIKVTSTDMTQTINLFINLMERPPKESIHLVYPSKGKKGSIYIANLDAAKNPQLLQQHNIGAVISVARGAFLQHSKEILPNYFYIPAYDHDQFDLSEYFDKTYQFIEKAAKKTNVLVHCRAGISRSATIVIAYLMKKQKKNWVQAYRQIKQFRPMIQPNDGFLRQLKGYQDQILKTSNKAANISQKKVEEKRGVSCNGTKASTAKQNKETLLQKGKEDYSIILVRRTPRLEKSRSRMRHTYKLSQLSSKRPEIPWAINY